MTATTWTPPDDLNPSEILHSAVADTRSGIHEVALAKFLWFHHNALRYEQAFGGVRLSYALSSWLDLAKSYPPAREAFINTRDDTEAAFRADMSDFDLFHDATSLNRELGEASRTADLFGEVAACDLAKAQQLYSLAEPDLIALGRFHSCAPFLDPQRRMELAAATYGMTNSCEETRSFARPFYVDDVATLVALLVLSNRVADAKAAYDKALQVVTDADFRAIMDAALTGHFPRSLVAVLHEALTAAEGNSRPVEE